ncbi:hypothetical protein HOD08_02100, partial [bacterium]|nr:hypothetical protein [bacterium]
RGVGAALNLWRRQTGLAGGEIPELNEPRRCSKMGNKLFARSFSTLEEEVEGRQKVTKWYLEKMDEKFVIPQQGPKGAEPSYFRFNLRLKPELASKRDEVLLKLRRKGVFADRLWSNAPAKGFPNAELLAKSVINLPIKSTYSKKDVDKLFNIFYECF